VFSACGVVTRCVVLLSSCSALHSTRLVDSSEWLSKFEEFAANTDQYIELPGQYTGNSCPQPERHIRVVSFDPQLLVMVRAVSSPLKSRPLS
jgi:hypothetical protein